MADAVRALLRSAAGGALARFVRRLSPPLAGAYSQRSDALKACKPLGYDAPEVTNLVRAKTQRYAAQLAETKLPLSLSETDVTLLLAARLAARGRSLKVVDFGGACGSHYLLCRRLWGDSFAFDWTILETPAMARAGRETRHAQLAFVDDPSALANSAPDFVLASGSLPYANDPLATAKFLASLHARVVCVTRTSAVQLQDVLFAVERSPLRFHGPGPSADAPNKTVYTPFALIPEQMLVGTFSPDYELVLSRDEQSTLFHADVGMFALRTYVFLRRVN